MKGVDSFASKGSVWSGQWALVDNQRSHLRLLHGKREENFRRIKCLLRQRAVIITNFNVEWLLSFFEKRDADNFCKQGI